MNIQFRSPSMILVIAFFTACTMINAEEIKPQLENPMLEQYLQKNIRKSLPRLVYTKQMVKQVQKKIKSDAVSANLYAAIQSNTQAIYKEPLLTRVLEGRRLLFVSREFLYRMNMLGFSYLMQEDQKSLDRINEELLAVCNFADWNPSHFLDVAEMALGVAIALDWTQNKLPQSTILIAKKALEEKALLPSWPETGKTWDIANKANNWNQVCAGGLIAASICIAENNPELATKTIFRALNGLPNALFVYGPDGVYPEGATYWDYGTGYSVVTAAMLESAFGTDFGHYSYPGFKESADFRTLCNAPSGWLFNFSDCGDKNGTNGNEILAWFAMKSGNNTFFETDKFLQPINQMDKLSRLSGIAMAWISLFQENGVIKEPVIWKGDGENPIAIFRSNEEDPHQFYLGCKGGRANISHGNMDAGSFVFELNGVRWSLDPGVQNYNDLEKTGFNLWSREQNSDRWTLLTKNNFGHSTLSINDELFLNDASSPMLHFADGENPQVTFDLTRQYGQNIKVAIRTFKKERPTSMTIKDELELTEKTQLITWQLITTADVQIVKGGAILSQDGKKLNLENLSHPDIMVSVISLSPSPLKLDRQMEGLKRIEIRIPAWTIENGKTTLQIRLSEG